MQDRSKQIANYVKENVHRIELRFYKKEEELWSYVKNLGSTGIKELLQKKMEESNGKQQSDQ